MRPGVSIFRHVRPAALLSAALLLAVSAVSCKRRPLTTADNNVIVNIDIDYDIVNFPDPDEPSMMRVMFFDPEDGDFAAHAFLSATGGMVNVIPGRTYHVLAYNFDTESTVVGDEYYWYGIYATTNEVPESYKTRLKSRASRDDGELIVYEPDHHFVARERDIYVPARSVDAPPVVINLDASTIVETWKVYVDRVQGLQYAASIAGVISGQALSNTLAADEESEEQASVFFETMKVSPDGELEIRFNTFGYVPTEKQVITLVVTDTGGTGHEFDFDVSDQFPDNPEQEIYVKTEDIVIDEPDVPESSGGGLAPEVDEWDDVIIDIPV